MSKQRQNIRKWRLIVRNVSFNCTEDDVRTAFYKFGEIFEIDMPKKKGGFAGFCFVQYKTYDQAAKAMKAVNGQEIGKRTVAVDWAMPKDQYMTAVIEEMRQPKDDQKIILPKTVQQKDESVVKTSIDKKSIDRKSVDQKSIDTDEDQSGSSSDEGSANENDANTSDEEAENFVKAEPKKKSEDVQEGRTLFVRGVPFDVDDKELKMFFEKFGQLNYALICKFHDSDHSKGSGFVKFVEKSSADSCLQQSHEDQGLSIRGRRLTVCLAVSRLDAVKISSNKSEQEKEPTDKRNLHLLRVGLIRAGTHEAADMSDADTSKRMKIESSNRQKIKNLNIFVSPTRLVVHNLPTNFTDVQLKRLCLQILDDNSVLIKECRIMRDFDRSTSKGLGKSRGFAFMEFGEHKHALACVKKLNNNREVFTDKKRPIVEFSLENRLALNAKALRLEKSKINLKRPLEKNVVQHEVIKKQKMAYKPLVVPAAPGGPRKPFPSHMGPKIRTRGKKSKANQKRPKKRDASEISKKSGKKARNKSGPR